MMKHLIAAALLLAFAAPVPAASAAELNYSAPELLEMCKSPYDTDYGYCAGYVLAIANVMQGGSVSGYRACGQAPVKSQQLMEIYIRYVETTADAKNKDAMTAAAAAISRAFPCR